MAVIQLNSLLRLSKKSRFERLIAACSPACQSAQPSSPLADGSYRHMSTGQPGPSFDEAEVSKFSALAADWWNPKGPLAPLLSMNPVRTKFCRQVMSERFRLDLRDPEPLRGLSVLDVGCGGGLLSESLARLGAEVTGIDPSHENVGVATLHSQADARLAERLQYRQGTAEALVAEGRQYDTVVASEVIEHVPEPAGFCHALSTLTKPEGLVVVTTLNRTPRSYMGAIVGAEMLLGFLKRGTHDWSRFLTPEDLTMLMEQCGFKADRVAGFSLKFASGAWSITDDVAMNYAAAFSRAIDAEGSDVQLMQPVVPS